jgi:hypothetical protein
LDALTTPEVSKYFIVNSNVSSISSPMFKLVFGLILNPQKLFVELVESHIILVVPFLDEPVISTKYPKSLLWNTLPVYVLNS